MKKNHRESALIISSALIGAFMGKFIDQAFEWPFPWNIIILFFIIIALFYLIYKAYCRYC